MGLSLDSFANIVRCCRFCTREIPGRSRRWSLKHHKMGECCRVRTASSKPLPCKTATLSISTGIKVPLPWIVQHTYLLGLLNVGIVLGQPKKLESHFLAIICTLPNFGHLGGALGTVSLLHNIRKFIRRGDCIPASTQFRELRIMFPLRPLLGFLELLDKNNQNWEERW